ncbi:hypothetical protein CLG94_04885 [Candidatus Methylomirabilis limnetica]|uniref:Ig-like domain-containing protein n=1 Tax=Candidatus Methylomirabilis limnetica TaxID=2033718 RepID=A0A2T4TZ46_9BACT|nr:SUMF1/EgtB/PvdO family nonheme iron enzyme [Candidatus Methylomirabilis limnetica]PTL36371.1 hypothetical protein CLG94_04885 [Candidatus Methylomirabilis limnetica]
MRRLRWGLLIGVLGVTVVVATPPPSEAAQCAPDTVPSGNSCIDRYEASVWQTTNPGLIRLIKLGRVTLARLTAAGATPLGLAAGDLVAAGCPTTGNGCTNVYAVSIPGVEPAHDLTWFQAAAAARNAGKRLPTNAEWQAAALGTPDTGGADNGTTTCNTDNLAPGVTPTGSRSACVSDVGAFDMVGNLWEWVADWVPLSTICVTGLFGTGDANCLAGASTLNGPGALIRGGDFFGSVAGVFAVAGDNAPSGAFGRVGFRAAR